MSEAHGERRHQQRPRGETEERGQRRAKESKEGEQSREHTKQVNNDIIMGQCPSLPCSGIFLLSEAQSCQLTNYLEDENIYHVKRILYFLQYKFFAFLDRLEKSIFMSLSHKQSKKMNREGQALDLWRVMW